MPLLELSIVLFCDLKPFSWCVGPGAFERLSCAGQGQLLPLTGLELPGRSYEAIYICSSSVLDLGIHGRGHPVNKGCPPPVPGLGKLSKRSKAPQGLEEAQAVPELGNVKF